MTHTAVFALPQHLAAKSAAALIDTDQRHLALVAATIGEQKAALTEQLALLRRAPGGRGRGAMDRDLEIHRLSGRLGVLQRFDLDVCLGRIVTQDSTTLYIGRIGVSDPAGNPLLIDWRTPAAEPFFAATAAHPMGLASRRRYRWNGGHIVDYWDESFQLSASDDSLVLDQDSAFIASLATSRSPRMRDVLATLQADQDAIVRADSAGALVVDGGPGTGKTVVALHRAAYLLYADTRLSGAHGGLLFVGPHQHYLRYVSDVLPSLGEEGVLSCTVTQLVAEGAHAQPETQPQVAQLKASARLLEAVEPAVNLYEELPTTTMVVQTPWTDITLRRADWAEAFEAVDDGTPHNEARDDIWEALVDIAVEIGMSDVDPAEVSPAELRTSVVGNDEFREAFQRIWPILQASDLVADLWAVSAYLRRCAPWLTDDERRLLQRREGSPWTTADLPLLDAMQARVGDPKASLLRRRRRAIETEDRSFMDQVVSNLLEADDDPESPLPLLNRDSLRQSLMHDDAVPSAERDPLSGPFAHIIVDEAQELTDADWQMLLRRCPSRSFTIVGDRAQSRHGFPETWQQRLTRIGFGTVNQATLTINYRTPQEVMVAAEPVIKAVMPDANVPTSIRPGGVPVQEGTVTELLAVITDWRQTHPTGVACVIGMPSFPASERVASFSPVEVKGLEFDLVVMIEAGGFEDGYTGAVDRYVAMTRTTQQLVILRDAISPQ
ncbi:MAG: AAA family ATPase [Propionicimonas sp.]